jgi:hypothetical protein
MLSPNSAHAAASTLVLLAAAGIAAPIFWRFLSSGPPLKTWNKVQIVLGLMLAFTLGKTAAGAHTGAPKEFASMANGVTDFGLGWVASVLAWVLSKGGK